MKKLLAAFFAIFMFATVYGDSKVEELEKRVNELETNLKILEAQVKKLALFNQKLLEAGKKKKALIDNKNQKILEARSRFKQDLKTYSKEQLSEIEKLYQVANRNFRTPEARKSLETLISKYKKANRTGCAVLYLGQMSKGDEQLYYLNLAKDQFGDCFYANGVQVGAYARFYLGLRDLKEGKKEEAKKLFQEILTNYPGAIDHRGNKLDKYIVKYTK